MNVQKFFAQLSICFLLSVTVVAQNGDLPNNYHEIPKNYTEVRAKLIQAFEVDNRTLRTIGATDRQLNQVGLLNGELLRTMDKVGPKFDQSKTRAEANTHMANVERAFVKRMNGISRVLGPELYKKFLSVTAQLTAKLDNQAKRARATERAIPKPSYSTYVLDFVSEESRAMAQISLTANQKEQYGNLVRSQMPKLQATLTANTSTDKKLLEELTAVLLERNTRIEQILGTAKYKVFRKILLEIRTPNKK